MGMRRVGPLQQLRHEPEAERVDMIDRLIELDSKAAGTPENKDAGGKVMHKD